MKKITKTEVEAELRKIIDPELGIDIMTLGLIYEIKIVSETNVHILMTFTSPMCPAAGLLIKKVETYLQDLGFAKVDVEITFEPPWEPSEELRAILGV